jgi:hypothetical protein
MTSFSPWATPTEVDSTLTRFFSHPCCPGATSTMRPKGGVDTPCQSPLLHAVWLADGSGVTLNLFVACHHWPRRCVSARRFSAHRVHRGTPHECLLVHLYANFGLLQPPLHGAYACRPLVSPGLSTSRTLPAAAWYCRLAGQTTQRRCSLKAALGTAPWWSGGLRLGPQGSATVRCHKRCDTRAHSGPVGRCTPHGEGPTQTASPALPGRPPSGRSLPGGPQRRWPLPPDDCAE